MKQILIIIGLTLAVLLSNAPVYATPPIKDHAPAGGAGGSGSVYFGSVRPKYETSTIRVYTNQAKANAKINATARTKGIKVSGGWKPVGPVKSYTKVDPTIYSAQFRRHTR